MCGIVALVSPQPGHIDLAPALDALGHRGPDGRGVAASPCGRAHLGHTRLALVDLAGGAQPLRSEDGQLLAVVNGEFYGDDELRAGLAARGHTFATRSDSELLVHLYEEHGTDALRWLRGEFALALWDQRQQRLFAARDRFGIKPLVYARHGGGVVVASEVKALRALGVPAAWDEAAFFQAASLQYLLPGQTLFAGIRALPPGHLLVSDGERVQVEKFWDLDYPRPPLAPRDDDAAADELRRRLDEAVRLRLRGDVPVAFQLSGGIDSASVLASASAQTGRSLDAFTVSFGGVHDEVAAAREIAEFTGARLHVVEAPAAALAEVFADAVAAGEGLAINAHIAGKHLLTRAIREAGYRVALTGEGADEVLAGYAHLRVDLGGEAARLLASNQASAGLMLPAGESLPLGAVEAALGFVPTWLVAKGGMGLRLRPLLAPALRSRFSGHDPARALIGSFDLEQMRDRGRVEQSLYLWTRLALEGYILRTLGDAQEMAHGVEGRLPFLDHELFAWLRALPTSLKIRSGVEKFVLRQAQRGRLPESVRGREKHPFVAPALTGDLLSLANDLLRSEAARSCRLLDPTAIGSLLDSLPDRTAAERKELDPVLFLLMSTVVLQQRHGL